MAMSSSLAASPARAFAPRSQVQKLAMQAADQAYCLSLTLKTHNKLDHMILPEHKQHAEHACWIPVRPHFAELVHTFNAELVRELNALMQTLNALEGLMAHGEEAGRAAKHPDAPAQP